jgi:hypothetical protein
MKEQKKHKAANLKFVFLPGSEEAALWTSTSRRRDRCDFPYSSHYLHLKALDLIHKASIRKRSTSFWGCEAQHGSEVRGLSLCFTHPRLRAKEGGNL